jgi:hypothetical protein
MGYRETKKKKKKKKKNIWGKLFCAKPTSLIIKKIKNKKSPHR